MSALTTRSWIRDYALPTIGLIAFIVLPTVLAAVLFDVDLDVLMMLLSPLLAVLVGYAVEPPRIWITPAVAVVAMWLFALAVGGLDNAFMIAPLALLVGLPWSLAILGGKRLRARRRDQANRQPPTTGPQPA